MAYQGNSPSLPTEFKTINGSVVTGTGNITVDATTAAFTPTGNVAATNVQGAIAELDTEKEGALTPASQAEMEAGTESADRKMSPLRVAQAVAALTNLKIVRASRTSNTMLGVSDRNKWIDITSGTFSQTFDAAATLGAGWWCYLGNSGTGDITLTPNGAETIDGLTSYIMYPGEVRLIQCDGTTLRSIVIQSFSKTFTASGNFIKPPGYSWFDSLTWSGGNSGQKTGSTTTAMGGGGGGCFPARLPASALSASTAITVGAGGAARTTANTGALGGDSSIGTFIVVKQHTDYIYGGAVQLGSVSAVSAGDVGGVAADFGGLSTTIGHSLYGGVPSIDNAIPYTSMYGAGSGGVYSNAGGARPPGTSKFGGAGGAAGDAVSGSDGTAPGGGGGTRTGPQSGAGARGEVRIWGIL